MELLALRACARCSCLGFAKPDVFCPVCWRNVSRHFLDGPAMRQSDYEFLTFSLLIWREQNVIASLIQAQKEGAHPQLTERLVEMFLIAGRAGLFNKNKVNTYTYVPAPARRMGQKDHAYWIAKHLADKTKGELCMELERTDSKTQKSKNQSERNKAVLLCKAETEEFQNKRVIFIDDVITTGGTARAAYEALGRPRLFEVWTLCCRPKIKLI